MLEKSPVKGYDHDLGTAVSFPWEKAGSAGNVKPREEMAPGDLINVYK